MSHQKAHHPKGCVPLWVVGSITIQRTDGESYCYGIGFEAESKCSRTLSMIFLSDELLITALLPIGHLPCFHSFSTSFENLVSR